MKNTPVKTVVAIGIGAALFFVLGRFVSIPSPVPNTSVTLQYAVAAIFAALFGPLAGFATAFIGHSLIDFTLYGPWWSWIIASGVFGLLSGLLMKKLDVESGEFGKKQILTFNVAQIISHLVCWGLVAPVLDIAIYSEPVEKVFAQGLMGGVSNAVTTGIVGTLLLLAYSKTRTKKGSLSKD